MQVIKHDKRATYSKGEGHNYIPYYEEHLPEKVGSLLELGCYKSQSIRMWREVFPEADLFTIDLFQQHGMPDDINGLTCLKGDERDLNLLAQCPNNLEVCIEDCSHNSEPQQISFLYLFTHKLKSGGLWVTEDTHCCLPENKSYWGNDIDKFEDTILWAFKNYLKTGKMENKYFTNTSIELLIDKIELYEDKILFVWKK